MPKYSNYQAFTTEPNTPESDQQAKVWHTVQFNEDGKHGEMTLLAECPMSAITKAQRLHNEV
jgi:hypothetical protein